MKGFIEVTQRNGTKILVAVKEIKAIEDFGDERLIILDLDVSRKSVFHGYFLLTDSYEEIKSKIEAAT